ncbi:enkurin [Bombyx mandarina]|uniref:Enkurin domain-containing protein n=2 Tax=Bombyx TaxID=7090 RepID=A0A8R2AMM5_BOMMO|nr:enkurin [Bombyx mori]XP_028034980.1 enkurin [Bombyx mandarina]
MSLVEIVHHNEVIYTILDKPPPEPPKTPRYESKLEKELKETKKPKLRRTFGYAETPVKPPEQFLKKGEGIGQPVKCTDHQCVGGNLPPVPRRPPPGKKEEKPQKNFKILNIKKAIKTKAKPVEPRLVDTRDGHIKKIKGSGEVPEYCLRPDFGRVPEYLVRRNRKIQKALEEIRLADQNKESLCKLISEEERQKLLKDLKNNWELMQKAFLQLPMLTDTIPKILRKTKMEQELKQLEKDIALVESNPYIYIYE